MKKAIAFLVFLVIMVLGFTVLPQSVETSSSDVIFYSPHQDDELLSMGVAIRNHIDAGFDVRIVLLTNGEASNARLRLNGDKYCYWHGKYHDPQDECYVHLTKSEFSQIRNNEFIRSVIALGVPLHKIHLYDYPDGGITVSQAKSVIEHFEGLYPNAKHKTMTYQDSHADHANAGQALLELYDANVVNDARFYIKDKEQDNIKGRWENYHSGMDKYIEDAAESYMTWEPANNRYAVGYHSVKNSFDNLLNDPRSKYHKPHE